MSNFPPEDPLERLTEEQREEIRAAVSLWARGRPPFEPVLGFIGGDMIRAWAIARAMQEMNHDRRTLRIYHVLRRGSAARIDRHVLNMFAVEMARTPLQELLREFRGRPPEAGAAPVIAT